MPDDPYSLADLARLADVTPRTVRYYVAQGLLPAPDAAGPATRYGEGHLARLRLIRRLQRDHLPLAEIRLRLERMGDDEVIATVSALSPQAPAPSQAPGDTLAFVRSLMARSGVRPTVPGSGSRRGMVPRRTAVAESLDATPAPLAAMAPAQEMAISRPPGSAAPTPPLPAAPMPPGPNAPTASAVSPAAPGPIADRSTWERLAITPDVELHVRRPLDRTTNKRVDQLERIARELFEDT